MTFNVVFRLAPDLLALINTFNIDYASRLSSLEKTVSQLSSALDALESATNAAVARVTSDLAALRGQIKALQALVDAGTATPADLERLAALTARVDAEIDPTLPPA